MDDDVRIVPFDRADQIAPACDLKRNIPVPCILEAVNGAQFSPGECELLRQDGASPVLLLDDVFAELDGARRTRLAELVSSAEQVLVTAAVPEDVPPILEGARFDVHAGEVRRVR